MKRTFRILAAAILVTLSTVAACAQTPTSYNASIYQWSAKVLSGNTATGSGTTVTVVGAPGQNGPQLANGTVIPWSTIFQTLTPVLMNDANAEVVTPTSVSVGPCNGGNLGIGSATCATITGNFTLTHGQMGLVQDGSFGLQTAYNYAFLQGGGLVTIDNNWAGSVNTTPVNAPAAPVAAITAVVPFANVGIEDRRNGAVQYWTPQGNGTLLAAPTTLTSSTVGFGLNGANTTGGTYVGADTYHVTLACVDLYGQEGPGSADFSGLTAGTGSTNQIGIAAPGAKTGCVGYTIYISLQGGSYNLAYKVPLATYSNGVPTANGVCTLTKIETITAACAITNTTYSQTGSSAQVSALTLNTSPIVPQSAVISTTSVYIPNAGGQQAYALTPGSHIGTPGIPMAFLPFTTAPVTGSTVPTVIGTINLPANFMNFVGRTIEVCGEGVNASSQATIENIQMQWDAIGQNTAGKGVLVGNLTTTKTATTVMQSTFCQDFETTVSGSSATAGSILNPGGYLTSCIASLSACGDGGNVIQGATGSLNLANEARLNVIYLETTGDTDGEQLQGLTVKVLN